MKSRVENLGVPTLWKLQEGLCNAVTSGEDSCMFYSVLTDGITKAPVRSRRDALQNREVCILPSLTIQAGHDGTCERSRPKGLTES